MSRPDTLLENQTNRRILMIEAILFTDAVLARIEKDIREAGETLTPKNISERLTRQTRRNDGTAYFKMFVYGGVIDFYNTLRARVWEENGMLNRPNGYKGDSFYQADSKDMDVLKLYNTFIKHGFDEKYGGKDFRAKLEVEDKRFVEWTRKDSKKTRDFKPFPTGRPTL
jgi:hypothetical protein